VAKDDLTQERLKEVLTYSPDTGKFVWRVRKGPCKAGTEAGSPHNRGYILIHLDGHSYLAHRLAWLYVHGEFPPEGLFMDHINRVRDDNRIENLRVVTRLENNRNKYGKGCYMRQTRNGPRWYANIKTGESLRHLGTFTTEQEAHDAYLKAKSSIT
jgi:stalled ribosome alternative rescue factor ArfA